MTAADPQHGERARQPDEGSAPTVPGAHGGRRSRRPVAVGLVLLALGVVAVAGVSARGSGDPAGTASVAPGFEIEDLEDPEATVALADFEGTPLVVNFWASWCVPCRREMPALESARQWARGGVGFLGIDHQDERQSALALMGETGVRYPSGFDPQGRLAAEYGVFGLPTTIFISADGRIVERATGELTLPRIMEIIDQRFPGAVPGAGSPAGR